MFIQLLFLVSLWFLSEANSTLKWGIVGTGRGAKDFVTVVNALPEYEHHVVAVASRKFERAVQFAQKYNVHQPYEDYFNIAKDKNVEVVYLTVQNIYNYELIKEMLENGKHVLCRKSFSLNPKKTKEIVNLAKNKKLFLMEEILSRGYPVYSEMDKLCQSCVIGEIREVFARLGNNYQSVPRYNSKDFQASVTLDFGIYPLQFVQFVFGGIAPTRIVASGNINEEGVDQSVSAILTYPDGRRAIISVSNDVEMPATAIISADKGNITIPNFLAPTQLFVNNIEENFPLINNEDNFHYETASGLANSAKEVRKCIKSGELESKRMTHADSLQLSQMMDAIRKQVGAIEYS